MTEISVLIERVKTGNDKLFRAWQQIIEIKDKAEQAKQREAWHQATKKLSALCTELKLRGYVDCLYKGKDGKRTKSCLSNPDHFWCQVCPSATPYWEEELMNLGR